MEVFETFLFEFFFGLGPDGGVVRDAILDEMPEDAGQFVGHGGDGLGCAQAGFEAAETIPQIIWNARGFGRPGAAPSLPSTLRSPPA